MENKEVINHTPDNVFIGNNKFVDGTITCGANATLKDGYLMKYSDGKWAAAEAADIKADTPLGILAARDDIVNSTASAVNSYGRICNGGDVNANLVSVGGTALTGAQNEILRMQGIYNIDAKQIGVQDNQ